MLLHGIPLAFAANRLPDIHDAERRRDSEAAAFAEVRAVLAQHGLAHKYGLALLHKHFDLAEDEVLMEFTDFENRTLTSRPVKRGDPTLADAIETQWSLDNDTVMTACIVFCYSDPYATPSHRPSHQAR
jgi:hypothetical protein